MSITGPMVREAREQQKYMDWKKATDMGYSVYFTEKQMYLTQTPNMSVAGGVVV